MDHNQQEQVALPPVGGDRRGGRGQADGPGAEGAGPADRRPGARAPGRVVSQVLAGYDRPVAAGLAQGRAGGAQVGGAGGYRDGERPSGAVRRGRGPAAGAVRPVGRADRLDLVSPTRDRHLGADGPRPVALRRPGCTARRWPSSRRPTAGMRPARRPGNMACGPVEAPYAAAPTNWSRPSGPAYPRATTPGPARRLCHVAASGRRPAPRLRAASCRGAERLCAVLQSSFQVVTLAQTVNAGGAANRHSGAQLLGCKILQGYPMKQPGHSPYMCGMSESGSIVSAFDGGGPLGEGNHGRGYEGDPSVLGSCRGSGRSRCDGWDLPSGRC